MIDVDELVKSWEIFRDKMISVLTVNERKGGEVKMKKRVTVILEVESDDDISMSDDFIKDDLEQEINCASNSYEVISIKTELLT